MESMLILATELVIFSVILSLYLCRRHTILKVKPRAAQVDRTLCRHNSFFSRWRRVGRVSFRQFIHPTNRA